MKTKVQKKILKSNLFSGIGTRDYNLIMDSLDSQLKRYKTGQTILPAGMRVRRIGLVMEGMIGLYQENFWGSRQELFLHSAGQIFAEAFACDAEALSNITVIATEPSVILWFNVQDILRIEASDSSRTVLIRNIMSALAAKVLSLSAEARYASCRTTRDKLLAYLSNEAKIRGTNEFDIPYDRQELADYLKVDRSAMSSALSKLAKQGYFKTRKSHFILEQPSK